MGSFECGGIDYGARCAIVSNENNQRIVSG